MLYIFPPVWSASTINIVIHGLRVYTWYNLYNKITDTEIAHRESIKRMTPLWVTWDFMKDIFL